MNITLETLRNKESRDALIDDLIRMMEQKHIVTVLDFIPVEERLPEAEGDYHVISNDGSSITTDYFDLGFPDCPWLQEGRIDGDSIWTHWAKIPKIE